MNSATLPSALREFFEATEREVSELYRPAWLISNLDDVVWLVDGASDLRKVSGKLVGGISLRWNKLLWNGLLIDPLFEKVLYQARLIMVLAFDGVFNKLGNTLKTISGFHAFIFRVIEYLDYKYGRTFHADGFKVLTSEDVADMLDLSVEYGVSGTGFWIERLSHKVRESAGGNSDVPATIEFLKSIGAYDRSGNVSLVKLGPVIGVEPRRLARSFNFLAYLAQFEGAGSKVRANNKSSADKTVGQLANWFVVFVRVLILSPIQTAVDLSDETDISNLAKQFRGPVIGRTKTMPRHVASKLIRECCVWMEGFDEVQAYTNKIIAHAEKLCGRDTQMSIYDALGLAEAGSVIPAGLVKIDDFFERSSYVEYRATNHYLAPPFVIKLMRFHSSVCFVLVALLSCSRRKEVLEIGPEDLFEKCGLKYLNVNLRKTGLDSSRVKFAKPVPHLVGAVLKSLETLKVEWLKLLPSSDSLLAKRSFFKVSYKGLSPLTANDVYAPLGALGTYLSLAGSLDTPWTILPHQLRRYFALSFFHDSGAENSLPALTWFMGHENIEGTWRYIKESLTGKEISASEAALATSAVCSGDESEGAVQLRKTLCEHFGCSNISLMNEDDVQDYLEMLSGQGVFTATPIQIGIGAKKRVTIMISIKEHRHASA